MTDQTKPTSSKKFTFKMPGATVTIPVLKGASNWNRWYKQCTDSVKLQAFISFLPAK